MSSPECLFLKAHPHVTKPICRFVEAESENSSKVKVYYCECCGAINKVDLEALEEKSDGSGIIVVLGIFLMVVGIFITTQPQHTSPTHKDYFQQSK